MKRGLFIFLITIAALAQAQKPNAYSVMAEETWLPRQTIRTIYQDTIGNMWVGTNSGLYKYNLSTVTNFNFSQKATGRLVNNTIHSLNEDVKGNILVGTESGMALLKPATGSFFVLTSSDETILAIVKGIGGVRWILNSSGDVFRISGDASNLKPRSLVPFARLTDYPELTKKKITAIFPIGNDLLIGTNSGLFRCFTSTRKINQLITNENVTEIFASKAGLIYIGTAGRGLQILAEGKLYSANAMGTDTYITGLIPLNENTLVASSTQTLGLIETANQSYKPLNTGTDIFNEGSLTTSLVDHSGNIWLGSKRGLYKIKHQTLSVSFLHLTGTPALYKNVSNIWHDGDHSLFALNGSNKIIRRDINTGEEVAVSLPFSSINKIHAASNGTIVLVADHKLIEISRADLYTNEVKKIRILYDNAGRAEINDFHEVFPGEWWMTSWTRGLLRAMQNNENTPSAVYSLARKEFAAGTHLFSLTADNNNNVWIATRGEGLLRVNLYSNKVQHYRKEQGLSNRLVCVERDAKGNIWVGSRGDGLFLYQPEHNKFNQFTTAAGLPSNTVCAIAETSNGELWVSTLNGLARFGAKQMIPFTSFGAEDGINTPENNFNVSAVDNSGSVYFGNGNGIYKVQSLKSEKALSRPIIFTQFELLTRSGQEKPVNTDSNGTILNKMLSDGTVSLKHNENSIRIGFAALDFTTPEKNRYAYRLLGKDSGWQFLEGTNQNVQFLGLPAGNYTLEVRSATAGNEWTSSAQKLSFKILPSFWVSRNGYILYAAVILLAGLITLALRRRWVHLNRELKEEKQSAERFTQQMVFYTDLSHEIKNRLSLLLGPLEEALAGKKVNENVLNNLYDQAQRLKKLSDQIMNIRKGESGSFILSVSEENVRSTVEDLCRESQPLAVVKGVSLNFSAKQESIRGWCDEELLEIIVLNLIGNAIKYCKVDGSVEVDIAAQYLGPEDNAPAEGVYLVCKVRDSGIGIPGDEIKKVLQPFYRAGNTKLNRTDLSGTGIGLDLVARLIKLHHGWLDVKSELNEFTAITFYLPLDKAQYGLNELKPNLIHTPIVMPARVVSTQDAPNPSWNLLVVDDNEEIRNMLRSTLSEEFTVYTATNGEEGLRVLQEQDIQLILSDLSMPVMDGLSFCAEVRANEATASLPFIILTGRNSEEQKLVCFQNEVDDFIEKPFSPELLRWRVKSLLRSHSTKSRAKMRTVVVVEPQAEITESAEDKFIQSIINLIEENIEKDSLNVDFLAESLFMSRATFYRKMEEMVCESPSVFIRKYRLKKAALLLKTGNYFVNEVAAKTGFADPRYFSKCFQKEFGLTPSEFAAG